MGTTFLDADLRRFGRGGHRSTSKGAALQLTKWSGAPAPHKKERRSSRRSFTVLDVYKKVNVIFLL